MPRPYPRPIKLESPRVGPTQRYFFICDMNVQLRLRTSALIYFFRDHVRKRMGKASPRNDLIVDTAKKA